MKRMLIIVAAAPLLALVAHAQDDFKVKMDDMKARADEKMTQAMQMRVQAIGAVKGMTVKGAPYSGEEVNETNQVLADGTRIHRETSAMVYRDSEGRTRRETPDSIIITDPVANTTYILNPKTMTGQKLTTMVQYSSFRKAVPDGAAAAGSGSVSTFVMKMESDGGTPTITMNGETMDAQKVQEMMAKMKAEGLTANHMVVTSDSTVTSHVMGGGAGAMAGPIMIRKMGGESLGKRTVEGVEAEGNRTANTIKAGTIGNDRDIQVTGESWYSPELQTMISSKHSDPRTGDESFRLTSISRNEPAAYLFQVPSGYTITGK